MRSPSKYLLALVVALALGNLLTTFLRPGIPLSLTGVVERVEVRPEKHAGLDDVHLVTIAGRVIHLDAAVAAHLRPGDAVQKSWGSARMPTPRGTYRLGPAKDFWRLLLAMPLLTGLAAFLLGYRVRRARRPATR